MSTLKKKKNSAVMGVSQTRQPTSCANDNKKSCRQEPPSWRNIPAIALRKIYQSLHDTDRASMARVCRSWNQGFRDPILWREMCIWFCGGRTINDMKNDDLLKYVTELPSTTETIAPEFLKVFPTTLRDVEFIFCRVSQRAAKEMARDFKTLVTRLKKATLRNLSIYDLKVLWENEQLRKTLIDSVERLLQSQRSLRECHIHSACCDLDNGMKVLTCLAESSGTTIEELTLTKLFRKGTQIYREGRVVRELQKFRSIVHIHLDYDTISTELVQLWGRGFPNLSLISLFAKGAVPRSNVVSCDAWQALVGSHPILLVDLQASKIQNTRETLPILSPAMPVNKLEWDGWLDEITPEFELTSLLHRVAGYHRTLKVLNLSFEGKFPNLDPISVKNMLSNCKNLQATNQEVFTHLLIATVLSEKKSMCRESNI